MTVFIDTSAVVKLYVPERQHQVVRARTDHMVVSALTGVELASALGRKHRLGELHAADAAALYAAFDADVHEDAGRFSVVALRRDVLAQAVEAATRHGLRAYDAVQLATAMVARAALGRLEDFVAFDASLRPAAAAEGFTLVPDIVDR